MFPYRANILIMGDCCCGGCVGLESLVLWIVGVCNSYI